MPFFRFFDDRYMDSFLGGEIRFGRFDYYRIQEIVSQTGSETVSIGNQAEDFNKIMEDIEYKEIQEAKVVKSSGGGTVSLDDSTFFSKIDCFILSLSYGLSNELHRAVAQYSVEYNSCVEVFSPEKLARVLYEEGLIDGIPLRKSFKAFLGKVLYGDYHNYLRNVNFEQTSPSDPFEKQKVHSQQNEYRIILLPIRQNVTVLGDFFTVKIENTSRLFQEEFRNRSIPEDITHKFRISIHEADAIKILVDNIYLWNNWMLRDRYDLSHAELNEFSRIGLENREKVFELNRSDIIRAYSFLRGRFSYRQRYTLDKYVANSDRATAIIYHLEPYLEEIKAKLLSET